VRAAYSGLDRGKDLEQRDPARQYPDQDTTNADDFDALLKDTVNLTHVDDLRRPSLASTAAAA
jgi:hypothetical protein